MLVFQEMVSADFAPNWNRIPSRVAVLCGAYRKVRHFIISQRNGLIFGGKRSMHPPLSDSRYWVHVRFRAVANTRIFVVAYPMAIVS